MDYNLTDQSSLLFTCLVCKVTNLALAQILILTEFNVIQALSTINSSNLILHQILPLYSMHKYTPGGTFDV